MKLRSIHVLLLPILAGVAAAATAATYQVDPVHSSVHFRARHFGVSNVYGRFNDFSGTVTYDEADPAAGTVKLEVRTESVDTGNERRDQHLRSPDFFNAQQFPVLTFESRRVEKAGDGRFRVEGDLTILGTTKPVEAEVRLIGTGKHPQNNAPLLGFETELVVKRSDFGMEFMLGPVGDEIGVVVAIEAGAQQ